jgi:hypothetical protein
MDVYTEPAGKMLISRFLLHKPDGLGFVISVPMGYWKDT